jgi:hypothetical protein
VSRRWLPVVPLIAGLIVGCILYASQGIQYCQSAFASMGGQTIGQAFVDGASGGACAEYASTMGTWTAILLIVGVIVAAGGLSSLVRSLRAVEQPRYLPVQLVPEMIIPRPVSPTPAGWYPDPADTLSVRWFNGDDWTNQVRAR